MKKIIPFIILYGAILISKAQPQIEIWGMTERGGNGLGGVFKTDRNGNYPLMIKPFRGDVTGRNPFTGFCRAYNLKLYTAMAGGVYDDGVIIEFDPETGKLTTVANFNFEVNGSAPNGLIMALNGNLYGTSRNINSSKEEKGSIFTYDIITHTITKKVDFNGSNGQSPSGELLYGSNDKLYGITQKGGDHNAGVLFEYDPVTNVIEKKISFDNMVLPASALIQLNNGKIYGMTTSGGSNNKGTIYEYDIAGNTFSIKYNFGGSNDGANPYGGLTEGDDGYLYGLTTSGDGASADGVLFKFDPSTSVYTKLVDFDGTTKGSLPFCTLKKLNNGLLYGMTNKGGMNSAGTIFEFNPVTSQFRKRLDFDKINGDSPFSSFVEASNGNLYATTHDGGLTNSGVVFEYNYSSHSFKKIADLDYGVDGQYPSGTISVPETGKVYLVTPYGGLYGGGVLLEADPSLNMGTFTKIVDFNPATSGNHPVFAPKIAGNGKLYGTTEEGGLYNKGTLYEYDLFNNTFSIKYHFKEGEDGWKPTTGLVRAEEKLYGMTQHGGKNGSGVLFEFDYGNEIYTKKVDCTWGANSVYSCLEVENDKLYGLASQAMTITSGVLFEYDIKPNTLTTKYEFSDQKTGTHPCGTLVKERISGKLYGLTTGGGSSNGGTLFEYDPVSNIQKMIHDFADVKDGSNPYGSLLLADNGKLYGTTSSGGLYGKGVMFEFDQSKGIFTKKVDFDGPNGMAPRYSNLVEVCKSIHYFDTPSSNAICQNMSFTIQSGFINTDYTFQWFKDGGQLSFNSNLPYYTVTSAKPSDAGVYNCRVSNGCSRIYTVGKRIDILPLTDPSCKGLDIKENTALKQFTIYPNPATDAFTVQGNELSTKPVYIELIDLLGRCVYIAEKQLNSNDNQISISLENIGKGIYYVKIMDASGRMLQNEKLIRN